MTVPNGTYWALLGLVWVAAASGSFLLSAIELAVSAANPRKLRMLRGMRVPAAQRLEQALADPVRFLAAFMLGKSLLFLGTGLAAMWSVQQLELGGDARWAIFLGLAASLVLAQSLGRGWGRGLETRRGLALSAAAQYFDMLMSPLVWAVLVITRQWKDRRNGGGDMAYLSEEGLRQLIDLNEAGTDIKESERRMMASVMELRDTVVREVMIPRIDVVAVAVDQTLPEALDIILEAGHSRLPVYKDSLDSVEGILYAKDVLRIYRDSSLELPLRDVMRRPHFVPASKKVDSMLQDFQATRTHMAIVVDEFGGTSGLVTIEDLIEEIFGEIQDEYDQEQPELTRISEDLFEFDARLDLDDAARVLDTELPLDRAHTMGGFIFNTLGRVPRINDEVDTPEWRFRVTRLEASRIRKVQAMRLPAA